MIRRHPSKKVLREWLNGESEDAVDEHVSTCERCSNDLEALAAAETTDLSLREALSTVLAPPTDLAPRIEAGVIARLESRKVLGYIADLFGAGLETTRMFITDDLPEEN